MTQKHGTFADPRTTPLLVLAAITMMAMDSPRGSTLPTFDDEAYSSSHTVQSYAFECRSRHFSVTLDATPRRGVTLKAMINAGRPINDADRAAFQAELNQFRYVDQLFLTCTRQNFFYVLVGAPRVWDQKEVEAGKIPRRYSTIHFIGGRLARVTH